MNPTPLRPRAGAWLLAVLVLAPLAQAADPSSLAEPPQAALGRVLEPLPCLRYDVTVPGPAGDVRLGNETPGSRTCETQLELTWRGDRLGGEGSLTLEAALEDAPAPEPAESAMRVLGVGDPIPVPTGPAALLDRLAAGLFVDPPEPPGRVVVRVRFAATWLAPDCSDAGGEAEADVNGVAVQAAPDRSFFRDLCRLSQAPDSQALPGLAAGALAAVVRATPRAQAPDVLATLAFLSLLAPAPEIEPAREEAAAAQGEVALLVAPADGEASATEDVEATAILVEARQEARAEAAPREASLPRAAPSAVRLVERAQEAPARTAREADPPSARRLPVEPLARDEAAPPPPASSVGSTARATKLVVPDAAPRETGARVVVAGAALVLLLAFALYQRIGRPAALDHPARRALHAAAVARGAPATASELAAAVGLERKAAEYHLRYLARLGLLREESHPDAPRRFAPPAAPRPAPAPGLDERIVATLRERPGLSTREMARALGLKPMRADRHLKDLVLAGRLESQVRDGERRFFVVSRSS